MIQGVRRDGQGGVRRRSAGAGGGYTIIEVLIVIAIITALAALIFMAVGSALSTGRRNAERAWMENISFGVERFRKDHGFYPPLVAGDPATAAGEPSALVGTPPPNWPASRQWTGRRPRILGETLTGTADPVGAYLKQEADPFGRRFSVYSLPIYLMGNVGEDVTGLSKEGITRPDAEAGFAFSRQGREYAAYVDLKGLAGRARNEAAGANPGVPVLTDRWGTPLRYYRWEPTYHAAQARPVVFPAGAPGNDPSLAGTVRSTNAPYAVRLMGPGLMDPLTVANPQGDVLAAVRRLAQSRFALLSPGIDALVYDPTSPADLLATALGSAADPVLNRRYNTDNIVVIGGEP